jgi:transposase
MPWTLVVADRACGAQPRSRAQRRGGLAELQKGVCCFRLNILVRGKLGEGGARIVNRPDGPRLRDRNEAGVWQRLHELLLAELRTGDLLDLSRVAVDGSRLRAMKGGEATGRSPSVSKAFVDAGLKDQVAIHGVTVGIDVEVVSRLNGESGFRPLPTRWVVEQTQGTLVLHRRLVRDYEHEPDSTASRVYWAASENLARRLTHERTLPCGGRDRPARDPVPARQARRPPGRGRGGDHRTARAEGQALSRTRGG